jgi:hypothetical protein
MEIEKIKEIFSKEYHDRFFKYESSNKFYNISIEELHKQFYIFARQIDALLPDGYHKDEAIDALKTALFESRTSLYIEDSKNDIEPNKI